MIHISFYAIHRLIWRPLPTLGMLFAVTIAMTCCRLSTATEVEPYGWARNHRLIAHATGAINGFRLANCPEAFVANYGKGHRLFEVDLLFTSDKKLIGLHDWGVSVRTLQVSVPPGATLPLTYAQFKASKIYNRFTAMGLEDLIGLLKQYRDAYVITDTKITSGPDVSLAFSQIVDAAKAADPEVLDRIVPQFYNQAMYQTVKSIYPFKSWIYTLYASKDSQAEVVRFVGANGIRVVTMPNNSAASPEFIANLKAQGAYVFMHTINDTATVLKLYAKGVHGFYTDDLAPADLPAGTSEGGKYE